MSKLSGLKSKGKVYTIGGVELEIKPLGVDDFELFDLPEDAETKQYMDALMNLITKVLKESIPDATDEEIKKYVKMDHISEIQEAVMDVCGMNKIDKKTQMMQERLNAIKSKQAQGKTPGQE